MMAKGIAEAIENEISKGWCDKALRRAEICVNIYLHD